MYKSYFNGISKLPMNKRCFVLSSAHIFCERNHLILFIDKCAGLGAYCSFPIFWNRGFKRVQKTHQYLTFLKEYSHLKVWTFFFLCSSRPYSYFPTQPNGNEAYSVHLFVYKSVRLQIGFMIIDELMTTSMKCQTADTLLRYCKCVHAMIHWVCIRIQDWKKKRLKP